MRPWLTFPQVPESAREVCGGRFSWLKSARTLEIHSLRGNVDTRLRKVDSGEIGGVILAAAGLNRLGWHGRITEYLPIENFLPAAGQGAVGRGGQPGRSRS